MPGSHHADIRYGHIKTMADAEAAGVREAGVEADVFQYVTRFLSSLNSIESPRLFPRISCRKCTLRQNPAILLLHWRLFRNTTTSSLVISSVTLSNLNRCSHSLRQFPRSMESILGFNGKSLDKRNPCGENVWNFRFDRNSRWGTRTHCIPVIERCSPSWNGFHPPRLSGP